MEYPLVSDHYAFIMPFYLIYITIIQTEGNALNVQHITQHGTSNSDTMDGSISIYTVPAFQLLCFISCIIVYGESEKANA